MAVAAAKVMTKDHKPRLLMLHKVFSTAKLETRMRIHKKVQIIPIVTIQVLSTTKQASQIIQLLKRAANQPFVLNKVHRRRTRLIANPYKTKKLSKN